MALKDTSTEMYFSRAANAIHYVLARFRLDGYELTLWKSSLCNARFFHLKSLSWFHFARNKLAGGVTLGQSKQPLQNDHLTTSRNKRKNEGIAKRRYAKLL